MRTGDQAKDYGIVTVRPRPGRVAGRKESLFAAICFPVLAKNFGISRLRIFGVKNMARFHTLVGLGLASAMMIGTPVFASSPSASTTATKTVAKPATKLTAKPAAKPAVRAQAKPATRLAAAPARATPARSGGRMVKARLANGKTVTYDCSLAGNKTKQACKG